MSEPNEALLEVRNLKKYYPIPRFFELNQRYVRAVEDVSFSVGRGEIFGLVGESGCGKSTTGRTIMNLLPPTGGSVHFDGREIFDADNGRTVSKTEMRRLRRDMQIIFQDPYASLDPRLDVGSIVTEGLRELKIMSKRMAFERACELLELCGLDAYNIFKYPHEFSGGQRQRIGIARALAPEPKFIVGDEPIAALDVSIQAQILTLLQDLKEKMGLTYLFISHDLGVVRYFCDKIAVMYLGVVVETGTGEEIFKNALHPYTRALFSAIPKENPWEKKDRILLTGEVPSPANPPPGCKFHPRCSYKQSICAEEAPQLKEVSPGYFVACHVTV